MLRPELTKDPPSPIPVASYKKPRENKPRKIPQANQPSKHMMVQVDIDLNESTPATGSSLQQIESPKGQLDFSLHTDSSVRRSADAVYGPGSSLDRVITHPDNEKRTPISGTICVFPSHANTPRPAMGRPSSGTSPAGSLNGSQLSLPTQNPSMRSHNGSLPIPHHYPSHPAYSVVSGANNSPSLNAAASPYTYNILSNSNDSEDLHVVDQPNIGMRTLSIDTVRSPSDKGIGTSHILPGPPISPLPGLNMELPFPDVPLIPVHDEESFIGIEQPVMDATTTTTSSPFLHSGTSSITTLPSPLLNEPLSPFPASLSPYWTSGFTPAEVPSYLPDEYLNGSPYNPSTSVTGPGGQSGLISHGDSPYLRHNGVFSDNPSPYQTHSLMLYDSQPPESPSIDTYTSFPNFPDPSISQRRSYPMSPQSRSPYQSPGIILQHFGSIMSRMEPVAPNSTVDAYSHGTPSFHSDLAGASGSYTSSFDGQTTSQSSHLTLPDTQLTDHDARRNGYTQSRNGNALDPQNDSFTTTTDSDETPLVTTENRKSSNRDPWSSSALPHSSINRSALFSRVRDLNSYENFAINLDNEPITTAGRDFCSYSSIPDDLKLFYPQSNQKVLHRTSLLSPVQVTSVPRPTMYSVEGSGEDVPQSCSRLACLPKAGDQSSSLASTSNAEAPEDMFVKLPYSYQNRPSSGSPSQLIKPNSNPKTTPIIKTPGSVNGSPGIDLVIAAGVRVLLRDHRLAIGQKGKTVKSGSTPYQLSIGITTSEDREMETEINGKGQDALRLGSHVTKEKLEQPEESNRVRWCRVGPVGGVSKRKWSKILVILPPVYSKKRPPDTWVASGNRNDPQNDRFMTTPDPSDSPLIMTKIESSNKQPVLLSSSYFLPRSSSAINKPRRATFVPMVSSESETSLSPPICVPQTVSGSSTLLNTGYEDLVTDSDNETVTLPGTCIQANFLSDSDSDPESPYPQSSQKVPHHTSLLSPVQVAFIPGPTVGVEGDDKDVTQSRSRWGRIPKANNQGTPELSHPSEDDHDGASPEVEFTRLDTLQLSVTGSNVASVPDKNLVTISGEISEIVSAGNPNINASNEAISWSQQSTDTTEMFAIRRLSNGRVVEGSNVLQKAAPVDSSELAFQTLRKSSLDLLRLLADNERPGIGLDVFLPDKPTVYRRKERSRGEISPVWHLSLPRDWGGLTSYWSRDGTPRPNDPPETFKFGRPAAYQCNRKTGRRVDPIWFLHHHDWGSSVRWATYRRIRRLSKRRSDDLYDWIDSLASSWSSSPPGAFQNSSDFGIYRSTFVACEDYHMTTNNYNYPLGPGNGGVSPEELLRQIQIERRMLELERRMMQVERSILNIERSMFNIEQKLDRLQNRPPPEPDPPPDPHVYYSRDPHSNSSYSSAYTHHPPPDFYVNHARNHYGSSSYSTPTHNPPSNLYADYDRSHSMNSSDRIPHQHYPPHGSDTYHDRHPTNFSHGTRRRYHPYSPPNRRYASPVHCDFHSRPSTFDTSTQNSNNNGCTNYRTT